MSRCSALRRAGVQVAAGAAVTTFFAVTAAVPASAHVTVSSRRGRGRVRPAAAAGSRAAMKRLCALAAAWAAALLAALVIPAGAAAAHAELLSMTPADGATLASPPATVVLKYSEPMQLTGSEVVVTAPSGAAVSDGGPDIVDAVVTQRLAALTEVGRYQIAARVVSADGHPVTAKGSFSIQTAAAGGTPARSATSADDSSSNGPVLVVVAVAVLVGGALAVALVRRRRAAP
jgi:copper resistance protein C